MKNLNLKRWTAIVGMILLFLSTLQSQNLLINPGAESADTHGWIDPDDAWSADAAITPHSGDYFFWPARLDIPNTEMYQDVDISAYASSVDGNKLWLQLSGWLANWDQYPHDRATLAIEALDANGAQLSYLSRAHRSPVWTQYQIESRVPAGTRTLRVYLIATRFVGSDNDGYFDDLALTVSENEPTVFVTISSENDMRELPVDGTLQLLAVTSGGTDDGYVWSSSFEAVATVDTNGLVTAHKSGKFTIQAVGKQTGKTGYIELTAYNQQDIIFLEPQSGAQWAAGTTKEITWELKGSIPSATLSYSLNGGGDWEEIATIDTLDSGHFYWSVVDTDKTVNNCYLKMNWDGGQAISSAFNIGTNATFIGDSRVQHGVDSYRLSNYPNPFNPSTNIRYRLPKAGHVQLTVFNVRGKRLVTLMNGNQQAGWYEVPFNASSFPSGIYFYRLSTDNGFVRTQKMIFIR